MLTCGNPYCNLNDHTRECDESFGDDPIEKGNKMVDITGLDKALVLAALYNGARTQGMGLLWFVPGDMGHDEARRIFGASYGKFDYVKGRLMKVNLSANSFDPSLYDRDNGQGMAQACIDKLRASLITK